MFIGRERAQDSVNRLYSSDKFEFAVNMIGDKQLNY